MSLSKEQLEVVYNDLESSLYNFALRWVFDSGVAEEVVHEAFIRIWKIREKVEVKTIKPLLYKTTQNLALNEIRKKRLREVLPFLDWFESWDDLKPSMESSLIAEEELQKMKESLEKLPLKFKEVLLMSEFSDMSYQEIAETLNIAKGTVASRKNRAIEMLRSQMISGVEYV